MKHSIILPIAAGLIAMTACNNEKSANAPETAEKAEVLVLLDSGSPSKAYYDEDLKFNEVYVDEVQILVFKENGMIDTYSDEFEMLEDKVDENGDLLFGVRLTTTTGQRRIYAAVNVHQDLSVVTSEQELLGKVSYLKDNNSGHFEMFGSKDVTLGANNEVEIEVDRFVARVKIDKVTNALTNSVLAESAFIRRIFLTHAYGEADYNFASGNTIYATRGIFWNLDRNGTTLTEGGDEYKAVNSLIYQTISESVKSFDGSIGSGMSFEEPCCFYVYPDHGSEGEHTILVVEMQIQSRYYTYPVDITGIAGKIESNKSYEIGELVITRLGNPSNGDNTIDEGEDKPIEPADVDFTIKVKDWDTILLGEDGNFRF